MTSDNICPLQGKQQHPCLVCGKPTYHNFTNACLCGEHMDDPKRCVVCGKSVLQKFASFYCSKECWENDSF